MMSREPLRDAAVDLLKSVAIVTVIWIHACGQPFDFTAMPLEAYLTSWAVPGFLFASGYLRASVVPIPFATLRRWLIRLLVPYAVASIVALAYRRLVLHDPVTPGLAAFALATGSAWGIYYFVPVLGTALLAAYVLSRWPAGQAATWIVFAGTGLAAMQGLDPVLRWFGLFWAMRSPFSWLGYFLAGWMVARWRPVWAGWTPIRRRTLAAAAALAVAAVGASCVGGSSCQPISGGTIWAGNHCMIAAVFLLGVDLPSPRPVRFLSDASYPLYLYHFFFTQTVRLHGQRFGGHPGTVAVLAGVVGGLTVVVVGRALLGRHSRAVIG